MRYGYRPTELMFTADVIAILANENNPATSITVAELIDVFGCSNDPKHPKWTPSSDIRGGESLDTHMLLFRYRPQSARSYYVFELGRVWF